MRACIIAVGSEMLTPFRVDTNSLFITEHLNTIGVDVRMKAVVGDDVAELTALLRGALEWADVIVLTGRPESDVDATVQPIYGRWLTQAVPIATTILAVLGQIELHLTATAPDRSTAEPALDAAVREMQAALGEAVYSVNGQGLEAVV